MRLPPIVTLCALALLAVGCAEQMASDPADLKVTVAGMEDVNVQVRVDDGLPGSATGPLRAAANTESSTVELKVPGSETYDVLITRRSAENVLDAVPLESGRQQLAFSTQELTVDLEDLTGARVELQTPSGDLVEVRDNQGPGPITLPVLEASYNVVVSKGAYSASVPVDCATGAPCWSDDIVNTLTVDLEDLDGARVEIGTRDGALVEAVDNRGPGVVKIPVLEGRYRIDHITGAARASQSADCRDGRTCSTGDVVNTLSLDLRRQPRVRVELRAPGGGLARVSEDRGPGQIEIPLLEGRYQVVLIRPRGNPKRRTVNCEDGRRCAASIR